MITLSPELIGSLASQDERPVYDALGKPVVAPYARLPRLERLRASGNADETEVGDDKAQIVHESDDAETPSTGKADREKPSKIKMKGKGKSMKRYAVFHFVRLSRKLNQTRI